MTSTAAADNLYPLLLEPHLSEKMWGGRRLAQFVNKTLPPHKPIGESWETWEGCTIVNGAHQGQTLRALLRQHPNDVLGDAATANAPFPLLFKYIDAQDNLSLQVHPDDQFAQALENQPFGKTEAWYIIHAEPGAVLVHGFKPDVDLTTLRDRLARNAVAELLSFVPARNGDVLFVPAGTVHAIGKGIVLAEIQQSSDTTYRLYDWGRTDGFGRSRELHVEKSLQVSDLAGLSEHVIPPLEISHDGFEQHFLMACRYFVLERLAVRECVQALPLNGIFHILSVLAGETQIDYAGDGAHAVCAPRGQTILLPARLGTYGLTPLINPCTILRAYVPDLRADVIAPLRRAGHDTASIVRLGGAVAKHNDLVQLV